MNQDNKIIDVKDISELELKAIGFDKITQFNVLQSELKMIENELARRINIKDISDMNKPIEEVLKNEKEEN